VFQTQAIPPQPPPPHSNQRSRSKRRRSLRSTLEPRPKAFSPNGSKERVLVGPAILRSTSRQMAGTQIGVEVLDQLERS